MRFGNSAAGREDPPPLRPIVEVDEERFDLSLIDGHECHAVLRITTTWSFLREPSPSCSALTDVNWRPAPRRPRCGGRGAKRGRQDSAHDRKRAREENEVLEGTDAKLTRARLLVRGSDTGNTCAPLRRIEGRYESRPRG